MKHMSHVRHKTIITLYRAALKAARKLDAQFGGLEVRKPLDKMAWQNSAHEWSSPSDSEHGLPLCRISWSNSIADKVLHCAEYRLEALEELLPGLAQVRAWRHVCM